MGRNYSKIAGWLMVILGILIVGYSFIMFLSVFGFGFRLELVYESLMQLSNYVLLVLAIAEIFLGALVIHSKAKVAALIVNLITWLAIAIVVFGFDHYHQSPIVFIKVSIMPLIITIFLTAKNKNKKTDN